MATIRLIIAGSRNFKDFPKLEKEVLKFLKIHKRKGDVIEVLSGLARGADKLGETFANKYGLKVLPYPANWEVYGRKAGMIRNAEMAKNATHCVAFWDGSSSGTKRMIELAKKHELNLKVFVF